MKTIYIDSDDYQILSNLFQDLFFDVMVFGSRIKGTHRKFSDLDLYLKANKSIDTADIAQLRAQICDSSIPFMVDLIDYNQVSDGFKKILDTDGVNFFDTKPV